MEIKLCNEILRHIKELNNNNFSKRELRSFLLQHKYPSVEEYMSC